MPDPRTADIHELIAELKSKPTMHQKVGAPLTDEEIAQLEERSGFRVPPSYRVFLREFGDGAYNLYDTQPVDSFRSPRWFRDYKFRADLLGESLQLDGGGNIPKDSLFCLMTEDSNGGAWCWLTTESDEQGECPLAYLMEGTLYCKVPSFTEWVRALVVGKQEVIRTLDTEDKSGLG